MLRNILLAALLDEGLHALYELNLAAGALRIFISQGCV